MTTQDGLTRLFYGLGLALMIGWTVVAGRAILQPIIISVIVAYVVLGLAELIGRIPGFDGISLSMRYAFALLVISGLLALIVWLIVQNVTQISALIPGFQEQILALVQRGAVIIVLDDEPSWQSLRRDLMGYISLHRLVIGSVASVTSIIGTFTMILIYAGFILSE